MINLRWKTALSAAVLVLVLLIAGWREAPQTSISPVPEPVTTYHYDNLRTGWNSNETVLTTANVNKTTFGLLHSIGLDEQVDAQPLVVPGETITAGQHQGKHDVVYVATENNTIYALDASAGTVLLSANFGPAVPKPLSCGNNSSVVGINSTPVIDLASNSMYAIVYTLGDPNTNFSPAVPTYTIHEIDLADLKDRLAPVVVAASHPLTNGSTYHFNASQQRQRPALLDANGNIYAGFGSFCDFKTSSTRGWILGWQKGTLKVLSTSKLTDTQTPPKSSYYLSSVWMSGYGLASDASGNVYFVTGNSDKTNNVYDGVTDIQESVVKLTSTLSMSSIFTPADEFALDQADRDYGSGGVLLLPQQAGSIPHLAAAAGKEGNLFLLNQASLGGHTSTNSGIVGVVSIGNCWCGQSYFLSAVPHVVSSGGHTVNLWNLETSPSTKLVHAGSGNIISGQDPGFFTSVSSSGLNDAIIWAVSRPVSSTNTAVTLYAFDAQPSNGALPLLFSQAAGSWTHLGGNANIAPVVANGHVYVASYKRLSIFGLLPSGARSLTLTADPATPSVVSDNSQHEIFGTISTVSGSELTMQTRTGSMVSVDASLAIQNGLCIDLGVGGVIDVQGTFDANGVLEATSIQRAKDSPDLWPADI